MRRDLLPGSLSSPRRGAQRPSHKGKEKKSLSSHRHRFTSTMPYICWCFRIVCEIVIIGISFHNRNHNRNRNPFRRSRLRLRLRLRLGFLWDGNEKKSICLVPDFPLSYHYLLDNCRIPIWLTGLMFVSGRKG